MLSSYFTAQSPTVNRRDTGLGQVDFSIIDTAYDGGASTSKRTKYIKWTERDRYEIGKYASVYGPAATVKNFKQRFPTINESTARTFRNRVEADLKTAKAKGRSPKKAFP